MAKMTDAEVLAQTTTRVEAAVGFRDDELSGAREKANKYYRGDPFGDEIEGRSQVVSRDVAQHIDTMTPSLMRIFASADEVARFEPSEPGDEEAADQATDYVNWIWNQQNEGFSVFHDWFKDAMLNRLGVIKIWWDEAPQKTREEYKGLDANELQALYLDQDIEVGSVSPGQPIMVATPEGGQMQQPTFDAVVVRTNLLGRVRVANMPPEDFLFGSRARSLNIDDAGVLTHRSLKTRSELIAMGYDRKLVEGLPAYGDDSALSEKLIRHEDVDTSISASEDSGEDKVEVFEAYTRLDRDGDGISELLKVCYCGPELLDVEEVDDHPFATITPIPVPHRLVGLSIADQVMDIQKAKSGIWRGALDNMYLTNMPQLGVVVDQVNTDDLLTRRPGGIVRVRQPGAVFPIPTQPLGAEPLGMIEYMDTVAEQRTGATRYNQGLDANSLNKTASGINLIQNAAAQRIELVARIFAETGVKRAFRRILQLVCKHQQKPKVIRLRNKWVQMNPRTWSDRMDMTVSVGLGNGNRDQQLAHLMTLLQTDMEIVKLQGGVAGPLVTAENVYAKLSKMVSAIGLKGVEAYYTNPREAQQPAEPPPDPKVIEAQMKIALEREMGQAKLAMEQQRAQDQAALDAWKAQQQMDLERWKASQDAALKSEQMQVQTDMDGAQQRAAHEARMVETLTKRQVEMHASAVKPIDDRVGQLGDQVQQTLQMAVQALQEFRQTAEALTNRVEEMAADMMAPREIVRGEDGKAVGVKIGNRTRQIARGEDGRAMGLS